MASALVTTYKKKTSALVTKKRKKKSKCSNFYLAELAGLIISVYAAPRLPILTPSISECLTCSIHIRIVLQVLLPIACS